MHKNEQEKKQKLIQIIRDAIAKDQALRDQYGIGNKFRFITEKLNELKNYVDLEFVTVEKEEKEALTVHEDETIVYVHLYNSQGISLPTWRKMVHGSVFYEYSINRPIYSHKNSIEAIIRGRTNKLQHAYLSVIVKKSDIINETMKDSLGNPLVKIKEGALKREKLLSFSHGGNDYTVSDEGEFLKQ